MATFWEIAARSVDNLFSLYFVYMYLLYLFISGFGFESGICLLIAPVPVHCFILLLLNFTLLTLLRHLKNILSIVILVFTQNHIIVFKIPQWPKLKNFYGFW